MQEKLDTAQPDNEMRQELQELAESLKLQLGNVNSADEESRPATQREAYQEIDKAVNKMVNKRPELIGTVLCKNGDNCWHYKQVLCTRLLLNTCHVLVT